MSTQATCRWSPTRPGRRASSTTQCTARTDGGPGTVPGHYGRPRHGITWRRIAAEEPMKPPPFEYHPVGSAGEALALLADHGDEAKVLAGGQSLVPLLALRL